jgi:hypothetical protein
MIFRTLRVSAFLLAITAASGCYDPPAITYDLPEAPPTDKDGWAIWSIPDPMLVLVEGGAYEVMLRCLRGVWNIELNEPPVLGAAQPPMTVVLNDIEWSGAPMEKLSGGSRFVEAKIPVGGENLSREALVGGLGANTRLRIAFNGVDKTLPPIPADLGARVGGFCMKVL